MSDTGRRADARQNYQRLLTTAREVFAERGAAAALDEIARRAGIGNATMYRHFPTRRDLIVAVYADEVAELCAAGQRLAEQHSPDAALREWLAKFISHVASKRELALAISQDHDGQRSQLFDQWHDAMGATATTLLDRAQRTGEVHPTTTVPDLLALASGIALTGADSGQVQRCLAVVLRGIAP